MSRGTAVLLLNLGGPATLEEVHPFLLRLFSDPEILRLPLQPVAARLLAAVRAPRVRANYRAIGGGSPLLRITRAQARALEERLRPRGVTAGVHAAMRYGEPSSARALAAARAAGARRAVALPLYPQFSDATTGSSLRDLERARDAAAPDLEILPVRSWADHPAYLDVLARRVGEALEAWPRAERAGVEVIFSAHALPRRMIERGDPYLEETRRTVAGVLQRVGPVSHHLAFQSRSGPVRWLGPGTDQTIRRLAAQGARSLLLVPVSFVSDHIETLYEVDILYRDLARSLGVTTYRRTASLNTDPDFIKALARIVEERLARERGVSRAQADL